jgi:hypothetical protein
MKAADLQRAEQEHADWLALQAGPGAGDPRGPDAQGLDSAGTLRERGKARAAERAVAGPQKGESAPEPHPSLTSRRSRLRGSQRQRSDPA